MPSDDAPSDARPEPKTALPIGRWVALLILLLAEGLVLGIRFDSDALASLPDGWWTAIIRNASSFVRIGAVVFAALFLVAGAKVRRGLSGSLTRDLAGHRLPPFLLAHLLCFAGLGVVSAAVFRDDGMAPRHATALVVGWLALLAATVVSWSLTILPPRRIPGLTRTYAPALALSLAVGLGAAGVGKLSQGLWLPLRRVTFGLSSLLLHLFVRQVIVDPAKLAFGTRGFVVDIAPQCSGYEGVGLTWVFLLAALWLFRDRLRFPRALWLLAIGTVVPFIANIVRLVALVLVGAFISPEIGAGGFHSYAGTLLFCGVALSTVALALRSPWFSRTAAVSAAAPTATVNLAAPYLVPFLALVVAGLVSRAFSVEGREPLYVLRPLVGLAVLAAFSATYRQPSWRALWRVSWFAAPIGLLVAAIWLGIDLLLPLAADAATAPAAPHGFGFAARLLTTLMVVPLAEELAFRGFLARRLSNAAFDELAPPAITVTGLLVSSLAFGLLHKRLLAGFLAGLCYALAFRARGRLADAVIAHAVTNAVLVLFALLAGAWGLWM
ncbi:MAG TPA: exosortase E/protease, VPEID-CTERM system [Polyangia bacterium]|jgi:exosortase E/protease (VPEID-CTERM system)|nr:exosortase E/protease, VPEID-CTERM system [Polyangia bacterium]